ncbi:MAG: MBL fold metallo-hydrolase [Clostridiales bacterium]|jgi:phosphoribosyl 1,2-cyclic phosphodiesterase|nr:MBL fold metallo-hydrolase [Clostridiales bacterium]
MLISFCTIASGSSGNSAFVSSGKTKVLVDAGLSGRALCCALAHVGEDPAELSAIFLSHEHGDHIKGAGILSRRFNLPIYLTAGTLANLERYNALGKIADDKLFLVRPGVPVHLDGLVATPFALPHDANEPVGYSFSNGRHKIGIATDLGHAPPDVAAHLADSDIILIESNHDIEMLKYGSYPAHLKQRILGPLGHLSNAACGMLLAKIISAKTKHIFLGHLSEENNRPALAYETVKNVLIANKFNVGEDFGLYLANRHNPGPLISLA